MSYFLICLCHETIVWSKKTIQFSPNSSKHKRKDIFRTRCVDRIEGMNDYDNLFVTVYNSLLTMKENNDIFHCNDEIVAKAKSIFKLIDDFKFIITLVITHRIPDYLLPIIKS